MKYHDLRDFIQQLEQMGELKRISVEVDPYLEMTEIADRVLRAEGPALLFENPKLSIHFEALALSATWGSVPALYSAIFVTPSPSGSASRSVALLRFNPFSISHTSGIPSLSSSKSQALPRLSSSWFL